MDLDELIFFANAGYFNLNILVTFVLYDLIVISFYFTWDWRDIKIF